MYLSKSKYCMLWQCPKMLWLNKYKPFLAELDPSAEQRFGVGTEVGELAKGLFGEYTDVTEVKADGSLNLAAMIEKTKRAIANGDRVICEAAFSFDGLYCAVDLLRKTADGYTIYEVKSSAHFNHIYAVDVAYQRYVLEACGINVTGTYLININSNYVFKDKLEVHKLFRITDISEYVEIEYSDVERLLKLAQSTLETADEPDKDIGPHCNSPYGCAFKGYCMRHIPSPSVFDLYKMQKTRKYELYYAGLYAFDKIIESGEKLTAIQRRQIDHAMSDRETHVDKQGVRAFLNKISYPLYFLDFETMQLAVPCFNGVKPYDQVPFQYSLHYMNEQGGEVFHKEFLAESGVDPRRSIAERLVADIPDNVCVLAYNKMFECGMLRGLADLFPDLAEHLRAIADNAVDLVEPFRGGHYYNRAMGGSFSIKSVLPAIFPDDPSLNYHNLDGVHNGTEAMNIFPLIKDMSIAEQTAARQSLLKYCELDTLAMVKILQELIRVAE